MNVSKKVPFPVKNPNNQPLRKNQLAKAQAYHQRSATYAVQKSNKILAGKASGVPDSDYSDRVNLEEILAEPKPHLVTMAQLQIVAPKGTRGGVLARAVDVINEVIQNEGSAMTYHLRDNFISWFTALDKVKNVSPEDYMNAVKYVTYRMSGDTMIRAYSKTFPDRVREMEMRNEPTSHLAGYASTYNRGKLVTEVSAMAIVPTHILYNDVFHQAVKTQVEIMTDTSVSAKVRSDAANSLLTHLKQPESKDSKLDITIKESNAITELRDVLSGISSVQREKIQDGEFTLLDVSETKLYQPNKYLDE